MAVEIKQIEPTKSALTRFVEYPIDYLYADNTHYVPALVIDEVDTLRPDRNPAFDFCDSIYFMAYRDGKPVGRIAGIVNSAVNERTGKREARFGFVDFIDDNEVVDALFGAVTRWALDQGLDTLTGPMGFTDMDREGMLIEGFEYDATQAEIYNHPYYPQHMERMGFEKDVDWLGLLIYVPDSIPEKMLRVADIVRRRYNVGNVHFTSRKKLVKQYGDAIFTLINEAYDSLFGYSPLTKRQIDHYIDMYLPFLPLDDISLIVRHDEGHDGELIGVGIAIPSLSKALVKGRGRLFPMGWWHLLKAFKGKNDVVDLMLVAIKPEYQSKGVNALLFTDLIPSFQRHGYKVAESNPELEANSKVLTQWDYFETKPTKRRRAYIKKLTPAAGGMQEKA